MSKRKTPHVRTELELQRTILARVTRRGERQCWPYKGQLHKIPHAVKGPGGRRVSVRSVVLNAHPDDGPFFVTCANPGCCNPIHLTSEPPEVRVGRVKLKLLKESLEDVEGTDERERAKFIKHSATMTYSELKYAETAATMRSEKLKELRKEISKIERCVVTWDRENAQKLRTRARKSETRET